MTCRDEVPAAFEALQRATQDLDFSTNDVLAQVRRSGSTYKDSTIRTHVAAHMVEDGSLVRTGRGTYRLSRHGDRGNAVPDASANPASPSDIRRMSPRRLARTPGPNGATQLATVLRHAGYASTLCVVAAHTVMLDPSVVRQTGGRGVFRTVRRDPRMNEQVGTFGELDGQPVMFDDNRSPIVAFIWAAGHGRGVDMQLKGSRRV